jgi:predicted AAA+ superfamily ATPase
VRYVQRALTAELLNAARTLGAVIVTGPRRAGKTTLLRHAFPRASYHLLQDSDAVARFRADPQGFLDDVRLPAILDEIQNVPEILPFIRARIDRTPSARGKWLLTGSQEAPLMKGVTESMAGRAAVLQLLPFSAAESPRVSVLRGGFPEAVGRPASAGLWFRSYVQTYLERDVRAVTAIRDLATFRRFLALVASRAGQMLNKTDLAAPLGVSVPTVSQWLGILETTGQILIIPPFFENFGKRLVKAPKIHFVDAGLACHLLGIDTEAALRRSPFLGPLYEGFVASEVAKHQLNSGRRRELYYFRDQQGLEVDLVVPAGERRLVLIEANASRTVTPRMGAPLQRLGRNTGGYDVTALVVHPGRPGAQETGALLPGIRAITDDTIGTALEAAHRRRGPA